MHFPILSNKKNERFFQIGDFENIEWPQILSGRHHASSFLVRKGLSRKAQLSVQIKKYLSKHPSSILSKAVPFTCVIDTWEAFDEMRLNFGGTFASFNTNMVLRSPLRERLQFCLEDNKCVVESENHSNWTWILKPSVTNKGLFKLTL